MNNENNGKILWRRRDESIFETIDANRGLCIVYGVTYWSKMLAEQKKIKIDYFCDRRAEQLHEMEGILVIDSKELEKKVIQSNKRATIIICVGTNKGVVISIYKDLIKLKLNADVFDYFENTEIFCDNFFEYNNKKYTLYEHSFNCGYINTRMTERSVELALAEEYLKSCGNHVIEIGAVTPYYFTNEKIKEIVDPTDLHNGVSIRKSMFECNLRGKDVLSISTVEHIGTGDFGISEEKNVLDAIEKIMHESLTYLITAPLGYNQLLDDWIKNNINDTSITILKREINNCWIEINKSDYEEISYSPLWACGLVVISNCSN